MMRCHMKKRQNLPLAQPGTGECPEVIELFLFADRTKDEVNAEIERLYLAYPHLRHDDYDPQAEFHGGARLPAGAIKPSCALGDRVVEPGGGSI